MVDFNALVQERLQGVNLPVPPSQVDAPPEPQAAAGPTDFNALVQQRLQNPEGFQSRRLQLEAERAQAGPFATGDDVRARERDITQLRREDRRQALGEQVGQENLEEGFFDDPLIRADLAASRGFEAKRAKFHSYYPDGDFILVDEPPTVVVSPSGREIETAPSRGSTVLFRKNQNEPFLEFDTVGWTTNELWMDAIDIVVGAGPSIAGEVALTKGFGAIGSVILRGAAGTLVGEISNEAIERVRGFARETWDNAAQRIGFESLVAGLGGKVADTTIRGPLNLFRGRPLVEAAPGAEPAIAAVRELNLAGANIPGLMPNQVSNNVIIQRLGNLSSALTPAMGRYVQQQDKALVQVLGTLRDKNLAQFSKGEFTTLHREASDQIVAAMKLPDANLTDVGNAIARGLAEYENLSRATVDQLYLNARTKGAPVFDVSGLKTVARSIEAGIPVAQEGGAAVQAMPLPSSLRETVEMIKNLDPAMPSTTTISPTGQVVEVPAMEQLRSIQQSLFDIAYVGNYVTATPPDRQAARAAKKVLDSINHTIESATHTDPAFLAAWREANEAAALRFSTLEKAFVVNAKNIAEGGNLQTLASMAENLAQPLQRENIQLLKEIMPPARFEEMRQGMMADFISPRNRSTISAKLNNFDKETLDLIMTPLEQQGMRQVGENITRLDNVGIRRVLERQDTRRAAMSDLVNREDTAGINELVRLMPKDPQDPVRRQMRAGLVDDIILRSTRTNDSFDVINIDSNALTQTLQQYERMGVLRILTNEDVAVLNNAARVAQRIKSSTADAGTSIQAAQAVSGMRSFKESAFFTALEAFGTGRIYTNPTMQRILLGTGDAAPWQSLTPSRFGVVLGLELARIEEER
jgi:hypothetical protein